MVNRLVTISAALVASSIVSIHGQSAKGRVPHQRDFQASVELSAVVVQVNAPVIVQATIMNKSGTTFDGIRVHLEAYNSQNAKVDDQVFDDESFAPNQPRPFKTTWAFDKPGPYTVKIGLFQPQPDKYDVPSFYWKDSAAKIRVIPADVKTRDGN